MKSKAFTLIELLVVISIIGVLSSVIFVSFSGSRDKAKLAKAQQFDAQISHALGAYAVGIWRFESISGGKVSDDSGYGNDGTIHGNPFLVDSEVYPGTKALKFDGNDYVNCGRNASLRVASGDMTVETWVNLASLGKHHSILSKWTPWIFFISSSNRLYFYVRYDGSDHAVSGNTRLSANKWYHTVVIYTPSDHKVQFYLNGKKDGSPSFSKAMDNDGSSYVRMGGYGNLSTMLNGQIDNVSIYDEALSSAQIQQHYVAGAASHGIAVNNN